MLVNVLLLIKSVIMGIVEGVTEFLPISSTGHLILVGHLIGFESAFAKQLFEIVIQLGAILAVVVLYRKKIFKSFHSLRPGGEGFRLWSGIVLAFIPSGIVGVLFNSKVEKYLMRPVTVALALLVGGLWMIYAERRYRKNSRVKRIDDVSYRQAFVIGLFQCLSILWPGFSRSASTIIGGWIMGLSTVAAAEFSFFLAIPSMFCASGYSLVKSFKTGMVLSGWEVLALIIGFVVSFLVALIVVKKFIDFLKHRPMKGFAYYRIVVGVVILVMVLFRLF
ncbi:MAG TPA: undecaprenyl-diphosphate phosphatase [Clostridia bacterium]|nr:undecaprenyl-diphosphate phosphatase [Clostridia bacterium]